MENNLGPSIRHHEPYNMLIQNNIVQNNWNSGVGGGMQLRGPASLIECKVLNNIAKGDGGGIFYGTFTDGTEMDPGHSILTMDKDSEISGNKSYGNGGGIMLCGEQIHPGSNSINASVAYFAFNPAGGLLNPIQPIRVEFVLNGGTIKNNRCSGQGGGVCITRHRNCTFYGTNCYLYQGTIENNKTWSNNGGTGEGGGVALITSSDYDEESINCTAWLSDGTTLNKIDTVYPQDVKVVIGEINGDKEIKIQKNSGSDGGGIYVNARAVSYHDVTSKVSTTVYDYSNIGGATADLGNKATKNGGGLYVEYGDVNILGVGDISPTIQYNTTTEGHGGGIYLKEGLITAEYAVIQNNTAANNGGGINNHDGNILIKGCTIGGGEGKGNTATSGSGGGIFARKGSIFINIWDPEDPVHGDNYVVQDASQPTVITYNRAGNNGGGINTHQGKIFAVGKDYDSKVSISNNTAITGSGGGVFCMGESGSLTEYIRLVNAVIYQNEAMGTGDPIADEDGNVVTTGSGGGIYLQYGTINLIASTVNKNTANWNGGGINNQKGNIDLL